MDSQLGPWRQEAFLPRDPAFLLQLKAVYQLGCSIWPLLSRPQHLAATGCALWLETPATLPGWSESRLAGQTSARPYLASPNWPMTLAATHYSHTCGRHY